MRRWSSTATFGRTRRSPLELVSSIFGLAPVTNGEAWLTNFAHTVFRATSPRRSGYNEPAPTSSPWMPSIPRTTACLAYRGNRPRAWPTGRARSLPQPEQPQYQRP